MGTGAITGYIDVAQLALYGFWIFFFWLIVYLVREGKREGFPLESDRPDYAVIQGWPAIPEPKTYKLANGEEVQAPHFRDKPQELAARRVGNYPGAPIVPTGNPMLDGIGPGAWTARADHPEEMMDGQPKIRPLRWAGKDGYDVDHRDTDPRGLNVVGADGVVGGKVVDLWVDLVEMMFRFYEIQTNGGRRVLLPVTFCKIVKGEVRVPAVLGAHFEQVPGTREADSVTLREEDRIMGFYGGGLLYATPDRQEPLL